MCINDRARLEERRSGGYNVYTCDEWLACVGGSEAVGSRVGGGEIDSETVSTDWSSVS
jgi:hypothetical protein